MNSAKLFKWCHHLAPTRRDYLYLNQPDTVVKWLLVLLVSSVLSTAQATEYQSAADFVADSFDEVPAPAVLWLGQQEQHAAQDILGHRYGSLRVRYWREGEKTAWILDEIGKEKPITIGIVINAQQIERVAILAFRESRGGEVRHPFFTAQFIGSRMNSEWKLSQSVDGISGATMSVRAVTNIGRFALFLDQQVQQVSGMTAGR